MDTDEKQDDSPHGHCIRLTSITLVELSLVDKEELVQTLITASSGCYFLSPVVLGCYVGDTLTAHL